MPKPFAQQNKFPAYPIFLQGKVRKKGFPHPSAKKPAIFPTKSQTKGCKSLYKSGFSNQTQIKNGLSILKDLATFIRT